jgi:hypothetical protein
MSGGKSRQDGLETPRGEVLVYQEDDGRVKLEVRLEEETVWLTQQLIAELFQTSVPNISMHIRNIFEEGELTPEATLKKFLTVRQEGARQVQRNLDFYNLDMIISVGYRVKSLIATRFRIWATRQLREFLVKGFVMDDERLKNPPVKGSAVPDSINELLALDSTSPSRLSIRHSRAGGNPEPSLQSWIPACAGMTGQIVAAGKSFGVVNITAKLWEAGGNEVPSLSEV